MKASVSWTTPKPTRSFIPFLKRRTAKRARDLAQAVWQGAVDRTPVASGELRASWTLSLGAPNYQTVGRPDSSPGSTGAPIPKPEMPQIEVAPLREARYYVANGKSYAGYVEYGTVTITPQLMLKRAIGAVGR